MVSTVLGSIRTRATVDREHDPCGVLDGKLLRFLVQTFLESSLFLPYHSHSRPPRHSGLLLPGPKTEEVLWIERDVVYGSRLFLQLFGVADDHDHIKHEVDEDEDDEELSPLSSESRRSSRLSSRYSSRTTRVSGK